MRLLLTMLIVSSVFVAPIWAESFSENSLPEITVVDTSAITTAGTSVLDLQTLQSLPQGDGAITDLLKVLPGIQFSETDNSSLTGGEILPAEISISGGRVYDNNFMIDGISNNSLLDPGEKDVDDESTVQGHSQELFLDSSLLDSLTVYRSNIPAKYSGFTGGVVEMETRNPGNIFSGHLNYRTTRSEWTSFHVDSDDEQEFENSETSESQPEFRKHYGSVLLDVPLRDDMGVIISYSQNYSSIPLMLLGDTVNQFRRNENLFLKYQYVVNESTSLTLTGLSTPYEGKYFLKDTLDSKYSIEGGGLSLNAELRHQFSVAEVTVRAGLMQSENSRTAPADLYSWAVTESTPWGAIVGSKISKEGGYGDVEQTQDSVSFGLDSVFKSLEVLGAIHQFNAGISVERAEATYERTEEHVFYYYSANEDVVCDLNTVECIDGEQFVYYKKIYAENEANAEVTLIDLYLDDIVTFGPLSLRPGLHYDYNDLTKNSDYAARFGVFYDLFENKKTIFNFGINRYYGKTFLTYKLYEDVAPYEKWKRSTKLTGSTPDPWPPFPTERIVPLKRFSSLDTPYVDEWSIGVDHELFGGLFSCNYIERNGEDLLGLTLLDVDENKIMYSEWNNNGESRHKELTLSWERQWQSHYLLVDATWQDSESSNEEYSKRLEDEDLDEIVWYNDHTTYLIDLPRADYNREWSANLIYSTTLPYGFSFTNIIRYRSGYEAIGDTGENYLLDGEKIDIYDDISYPSATTFDWKIEWEYRVIDDQTMIISADITNVFNRKIYTGIDGEYQMGRQLWVGVDYQF